MVFRLRRIGRSARVGIGSISFLESKRWSKMDLRTVTMDIPPEDVITRDNVSVKVNAVFYFRVLDPNLAVREVAITFCDLATCPSDPAQSVGVKES